MDGAPQALEQAKHHITGYLYTHLLACQYKSWGLALEMLCGGKAY